MKIKLEEKVIPQRTETVENLWNFFSSHATQVSVLNAIQKTMKDLDMK